MGGINKRHTRGEAMTQIVHWKDIVGKDFLNEFEKITRSILSAHNVGRPESDVLGKLDASVQEKYEMKRDLMRKCGYEIRGKYLFSWHGWYTSCLERGELRFKTTAHPDGRKYISITTFLDWKKGYDLDQAVEEYYDTKDIQKVADDFIHED